MKRFSVFFSMLLFFCSALAAQAAAPGMVLTVQDGAWAVRNGERVRLEAKHEVFAGDELVTDSTGRLQVIFSDDTTISLGADTQVAVDEFVFDEPGGKDSFSASMAQGAARFVTGKVVERNRAGFSVSTPQATVGIRGTTFTVSVSGQGVTSVIGLNVNSAFPISVTNVNTGAVSVISKSGMAVDAAPSGNSAYQTPPGQFSQSSSAVNGSAKAQAASAQASGAQQARSSVAGTSATYSSALFEGSDSGLQVAMLNTDSTATVDSGVSATVNPGVSDSGSVAAAPTPSTVTPPTVTPPVVTPPVITPSVTPPVIPPTTPGPDHSNLVGHYSGTLYRSPIGPWSATGGFSFDVNLNAGKAEITNSTLYITDSFGHYGRGIKAAQNGTSVINNGNFKTNMKVTADPHSTWGISVGSTSGYLRGAIDSSRNVTGKWKINGLYLGNPEMHMETP